MLTGGCRRTTSNRIAAMNAGRRHDNGNLLKLATRLSRKERDKREEVARGDKTKGAIVLVQPYISIQLVSQILPTSKICRRPEEDPENRNERFRSLVCTGYGQPFRIAFYGNSCPCNYRRQRSSRAEELTRTPSRESWRGMRPFSFSEIRFETLAVARGPDHSTM